MSTPPKPPRIDVIAGGTLPKLEKTRFAWAPSKITIGLEFVDDTDFIIVSRCLPGSKREQACMATVEHLKWSGVPESNIHVEKQSVAEPWNKGKAINAAVAQTSRPYICQIDADLLPDWGGFFRWLSKNPEQADNPLMPFSYFGRLTEKQTNRAMGRKNRPAITLDLVDKQVQRGRCAGGFFVKREEYLACPMDESLEGWAGEDLDLAHRFVQTHGRKWVRYNRPALHHFHENDRAINLDKLNEVGQSGAFIAAPERVADWGKHKVIIAANGRSGGNLLQHILSQHPDVAVVDGEPLSSLEGARKGNPPMESGADVEAHISSLMTGPENVHVARALIGQVGPGRKKFWSKLHRKGWYVIRLSREDEVEWIASHYFAGQERKYIGEEYTAEPQDIPLDYVRRIASKRRIQDNAFEVGCRHIDPTRLIRVSYEDLVNKQSRVLDEIRSVLGLSEFDYEVTMTKQMTRPVEEMVTNIEEVRDALAELDPNRVTALHAARQVQELSFVDEGDPWEDTE